MGYRRWAVRAAGRRPPGRLAAALTLFAAVVAALFLAVSCSSPSARDSATQGEEATTPPAAAPTAQPPASGRAPAASPSTPASGATSPTAQATPVFVDEPCDPSAAQPQSAINGLTLYCSGNDGGMPVWATAPPSSPSPQPRTRGGLCESSDGGRIVQGSDGRPLECLRDPDGRYRWVDVS